jgi:hypothetical protein
MVLAVAQSKKSLSIKERSTGFASKPDQKLSEDDPNENCRFSLDLV